MKNERDFLDEMIAEHSKDPEFAKAWAESQARINIASLRKELNLTQAQVAERMGVARPRVAELERRPLSVSFGRMSAYARALGVSLARIDQAVHAEIAGSQ